MLEFEYFLALCNIKCAVGKKKTHHYNTLKFSTRKNIYYQNNKINKKKRVLLVFNYKWKNKKRKEKTIKF